MGEGAGDGDELRALRARAYGPGADIEADPAALARLRELEGVGRVAASGAEQAPTAPDAADPRPPAAPPLAAAVDAVPVSVAGRAAGGVGRGAASVRPAVGAGRGHRWAVVAVAVTGLLLAAGAATRSVIENAPVPVAALTARPGTTGVADGDDRRQPPLFPIAEDMQWSAPAGAALGWDVWIGRSRSNYACIVIVRSQTAHGDCVTPEGFRQSGATLYLPPNDIAVDGRPAELVGGAALAFVWRADTTVTVEVRR